VAYADARTRETSASPPVKGAKRIQKLPTGDVKLAARETRGARPLMKDAAALTYGARPDKMVASRSLTYR
jgi:hypothetical protein